jgi:hypothetical protein
MDNRNTYVALVGNPEDLGIDGSTVFKWILNKHDGRAGHMSQDRVKWRSVVNTAVSCRVP